MPQALRSIGAVIAGYISMAVVVVILTMICIRLFHLQSGHPTPLYLALNVVYSLAAALLGGFVAAKFAGIKPIEHGIALAVVMVLLGALTFTHSAGGQPFAYRIFIVIGPALAAIAGSALVNRGRQRAFETR